MTRGERDGRGSGERHLPEKVTMRDFSRSPGEQTNLSMPASWHPALSRALTRALPRSLGGVKSQECERTVHSTQDFALLRNRREKQKVQ